MGNAAEGANHDLYAWFCNFNRAVKPAVVHALTTGYVANCHREGNLCLLIIFCGPYS